VPVRILFVCTGNICRSPLAEAVAGRALAEHFQVADLSGIKLSTASAGTHALVGAPASRDMQQVAAEIGLDLSGHRSAQLFAADVADYSLVYATETRHLRWLRSQRADLPISLLGTGDIDDPYGLELSDYRRARQEIAEAVIQRLPEMIDLVD